MNLPECYHRGVEISAGKFSCSHPGLVVASTGVDAAGCEACSASGRFCNQTPRESHLLKTEQPDFPCINRLEVIDNVPCKTCGDKESTVPVYRCKLSEIGTCTIFARGIRGTNYELLQPCFSCDFRKET